MLEETMAPFSIHAGSPEYMKEEIKRLLTARILVQPKCL